MRLLSEQELKELNSVLSEFGPVLFGTTDLNFNVEQANNKLVISISEKDYQREFEEYLKTLDDDIFVEACAQYMKRTGQDLSKVEEITPKLIADFKAVIKLTAQSKIEAIREKYGC